MKKPVIYRNRRYPDNWHAIAESIKERAGWHCEQCGLEHGAIIARRNHPKSDYVLLASIDETPPLGYGRAVRVVLSVHHIGTPYPDGRAGDPHDKLDVRPENLTALCSRCHLLADLEHHISNARATRLMKRQRAARLAGQSSLWSDES